MRQTTVVLLCILVGTMLGAWYFHTHERVLRTEYIGYRGEARSNDFLAAELLLKALDIDADSRRTLKPTQWLPSIDDTIVSRLSAVLAVSDEQSTLLEWVGNGGHLVVLPPLQDTQGTNQFLRQIGAALLATDERVSGDDDDTTVADRRDADYVLDLDSTLHRVDLLQPDLFSATLSDDIGIVAARREWGNGYITIIASSTYFLNAALDDHDHARLLLDIVDGYLSPGKVWFVLHSDFDSLWQLLRDNALFLLVAAALTLLLWLWSIMPGFGPAIESRQPERRSILEHIVAAGQFAWRHRGSEALGNSSVAALVQRAETRHPGLARLSMDEQSIHLARLSGVPAPAILQVLLGGEETRHREFTHNVQLIQRVRTKL